MQLIAGADKYQNLDYLVADICRLRQANKCKRIFVIVPENRNMLVEKALLAQKTGGQLFFTEVLSLRRLIYRLFSETFAFKKEAVSKELASLLIYKYVKKVQAEAATEKQLAYLALSNYFYKPEYMQKLLNTEADIRRFQLDIPNLLPKLDKLRTAKANKLRQKLQALQDLSTAYQTALEEAELTDSVGLAQALIKLLSDYQATIKQGAVANSVFQRLKFVTESSFYFYGYAEDNFITQQEWAVLEKLTELGADIHLSLRLPNLLAQYTNKQALINLLTIKTQGNINYLSHTNIRELASDIWLSFFDALPKQAGQLYQAGIAALLTAISRKKLGPLTLSYLVPQYDSNQLGVEAKLCQLPEAKLGTVKDTQIARTREGKEPNETTAQIGRANEQVHDSCKQNLDISLAEIPAQRPIKIHLNNDKIELFRCLLRQVQADCCGKQAKFNFADCAILFAKYEEDSSDFLNIANEFGLPLYLAEEQQQSPILSSYLHNLWQILHYGLNRESVLAFLRSALWQTSLSASDVDSYENYIVSNDLNYNYLLGPFRTISDFNLAELQRDSVNCLVEAKAGYISSEILWPLANLQKQLRRAQNRHERLLALLKYLQDSNLALRVEKLALELAEKATPLHRQAALTLQTAFAKFIKHYRELFEYSSDIKDEELGDFLTSLDLDFAAIENKMWPSQGGQIFVGACDKAFYMRFRQVYLINCEQITNLITSNQEGVLSLADLDLLANFEKLTTVNDLAEKAKSKEIKQATVALNMGLAEQRKLLNLFYDILVLPNCELNIWQVGNNFSPLQKQILTLKGTSILKFEQSSSEQKTLDYLTSNDAISQKLQTVLENIFTNKASQESKDENVLCQQLRENYLAAYELSRKTSQAYPKRRYRLALLQLVKIAQDCFNTLNQAKVSLATDANLELANTSLQNKWELKEELLANQRALEPCHIDFNLLKRLLAGQYKFSINQLEAYRQNPFAYFCRYLLGLKEASTQSKDLRNYGILLHAFAEVAVRAFYVTAYNILTNDDKATALNLLTASTNISLLKDILQAKQFAKLGSLPKLTSEQECKFVPIYKNLVAPFTKDYDLAISLLSFLQNSERSDLSLSEQNNLAQTLQALKLEQEAKQKLVVNVLQTVEQRANLDFSNLLYEQVIYPQLISQASYSLKHILGAYNKELFNVPSNLEQRFELELFDDSLAKAFFSQPEKLAIAKQIRLLGKIDRIDKLYTADNIADSQALIDYKSGEKSFDYEKLLAGIDLQMPLYTALVSNKLPVSEAIYLRLKNLYANNSNELVYKQVTDIAPNYFISQPELDNLWEQLKLPNENKAVDQFTLDKKDDKQNRALLASLANYSLHLSQASLVNILAGQFAYQPLLSQDGLGNLPYSALAKYDVKQQAYHYLASEASDLSGQAKTKYLTEQLKNALLLWQSELDREKEKHE